MSTSMLTSCQKELILVSRLIDWSINCCWTWLNSTMLLNFSFSDSLPWKY